MVIKKQVWLNNKIEPKVNNLCGFLHGLGATAAHNFRVCRTWHRTYGVKVPVPGRSRAEGKEKGKGIVAGWGRTKLTH